MFIVIRSFTALMLLRIIIIVFIIVDIIIVVVIIMIIIMVLMFIVVLALWPRVGRSREASSALQDRSVP